MQLDPDAAVRAAAFAELERLVLAHGPHLPWSVIARGFSYGGERVLFANRPEGIFKPVRMTGALSMKMVVPKKGRETRYRDQELGEPDYRTGLLAYDLQERGRADSTNVALKKAYERQAPLIYLHGVRPRVYEPMWPVWVEHFSYAEGRVLLAAADLLDPASSSFQAARVGNETPATELRDRSSSLVAARRRNHRAWFSSRVKSAYGHRCAFSGLPLQRLLVGARIRADAAGGRETVNNGICMSTLHHTAFGAHLIGVDPDCRIHVARSVREGEDGPLLEGLKGLHRTRLRLPRRTGDRPNRDILDWRFQRFLEAAD